MVEALSRVLAVLRKRPLSPEHADDDASATKKVKLEQEEAGRRVQEDVAGRDEHPADDVEDPSQGADDNKAATPPADTDTSDSVVAVAVTDDAEAAEDDALAVSMLECPVCVDTMQPPVRQCINGHCVCNSCRGRVTSCPLCRGPLSFSTHDALDHLAQTLTLPCVHRSLGCARRVKVTERESHLLECAFNCGPCPLQPCAWRGPFQAARAHCLETHPSRARVVALDSKVSFSLEVLDGDPVKSSLRFEDVGLFVGAETFVVEVHADELPGRVAVLARQLSAGRLRPPAHVCVLALRSSSRPHSVLNARVPALEQNELLVPAVDAGRCLVAAEEAVGRLVVGGGGLALECTVALPPGPAAPGWLSWLAGKVWPRPEY
ncbi:uncharacterized protein LOC113207164 [Frankliniella occidentalis]|uniref:RING-type E3 ubiquitin transferase n=1 Tax=Frankliniella occidentalis TaxID=133901 RepID=A0A6J1SLF3_FRAOC|nr:uncharacterized protein LOC113207164 [Frankliniella occidentalis]